MKLAVSFLIIAMFVPPMLSMADDVSEEADIDIMAEEARRLIDTIHRVYYSGVGSEASLTPDLPTGCGLAVGGGSGESYTVRLVSDGEVVDECYIENPAVAVAGDESVIAGGKAVVLRCVLLDGRVCVEVSG